MDRLSFVIDLYRGMLKDDTYDADDILNAFMIAPPHEMHDATSISFGPPFYCVHSCNLSLSLFY